MKQTIQYKNSAIGKIPIDWEVKKIKEVVYTASIPYKYQTKEYLNKGRFRIIDQGKSDYVGFSNDESHLINDIPLVLFGDHTKIVKFINYPFCVGADGTKLLKSETVKNEYLFYLISQAVLKLPDLSYSRHFTELKSIHIAIPPLPEQQKIAKVLFTWDKAIQETDVIIKKIKIRNKALANKLFLDNDKMPNQKKIMQIVDRIKNSFTPEENTLYKQIGIRSHAKGLFYKEAVTGKSLGNKSVFWIEPNCFVVNIVFAWEQAIGKTTDADIGFIASHRFPMYKPKEGVLNLDYLLYFFKSLKGKYLLELASPGGAGRNKTLGQTDFLKLKIPVPSMEEQIRLVDVLNTATKELQHYQQKLNNLKLQKKGLMQQLLTGKTRIK